MGFRKHAYTYSKFKFQNIQTNLKRLSIIGIHIMFDILQFVKQKVSKTFALHVTIKLKKLQTIQNVKQILVHPFISTVNNFNVQFIWTYKSNDQIIDCIIQAKKVDDLQIMLYLLLSFIPSPAVNKGFICDRQSNFR